MNREQGLNEIRQERAQRLSPSSISGSAPRSNPTRIYIAGVGIDNVTEREALERIEALIGRRKAHYMSVVNAAKIVAASRDDELRDILEQAELVTADGMSVVWASRLLGEPLKERVTGIDLFERIVALARDRSLSVYFLGARASSVEGVVSRFRALYPSLRISGFRDGYFDRVESSAVAGSVRDSGADILFVALGSPSQERWIARHLEQSGVRFALGVGGSFDHVSGRSKRAPVWMQQAGLEWVYRLIREPKRLWKRYLLGNTVFVWLVLRQMLKKKRNG